VIGHAVVDASVALKWVLPEPDSEAAASLQGAVMHAPDLLMAECGNALWVRARRGELSADEARNCFEVLDGAPVSLVASGGLAAPAFALSLELDQTVYDCLYLALAVRRDTPLVTADRRFHDAVAQHQELGGRTLLLGDLARGR
jgi:predicted nucleic acid-binding protein